MALINTLQMSTHKSKCKIFIFQNIFCHQISNIFWCNSTLYLKHKLTTLNCVVLVLLICWKIDAYQEYVFNKMQKVQNVCSSEQIFFPKLATHFKDNTHFKTLKLEGGVLAQWIACQTLDRRIRIRYPPSKIHWVHWKRRWSYEGHLIIIRY